MVRVCHGHALSLSLPSHSSSLFLNLSRRSWYWSMDGTLYMTAKDAPERLQLRQGSRYVGVHWRPLCRLRSPFETVSLQSRPWSCHMQVRVSAHSLALQTLQGCDASHHVHLMHSAGDGEAGLDIMFDSRGPCPTRTSVKILVL